MNGLVIVTIRLISFIVSLEGPGTGWVRTGLEGSQWRTVSLEIVSPLLEILLKQFSMKRSQLICDVPKLEANSKIPLHPCGGSGVKSTPSPETPFPVSLPPPLVPEQRVIEQVNYER